MSAVPHYGDAERNNNNKKKRKQVVVAAAAVVVEEEEEAEKEEKSCFITRYWQQSFLREEVLLNERKGPVSSRCSKGRLAL